MDAWCCHHIVGHALRLNRTVQGTRTCQEGSKMRARACQEKEKKRKKTANKQTTTTFTPTHGEGFQALPDEGGGLAGVHCVVPHHQVQTVLAHPVVKVVVHVAHEGVHPVLGHPLQAALAIPAPDATKRRNR